MTARDIRYGRRGGNWIDGPPIPVRDCDVCGHPMTVGQTDRHYVCDPTSPVHTPTPTSTRSEGDDG